MSTILAPSTTCQMPLSMWLSCLEKRRETSCHAVLQALFKTPGVGVANVAMDLGVLGPGTLLADATHCACAFGGRFMACIGQGMLSMHVLTQPCCI